MILPPVAAGQGNDRPPHDRRLGAGRGRQQPNPKIISTLWHLLEVALMQNKPNLSKSKLDCPFLDVLVDDLDVGAELVGAAEAAAADGAAVRLLLV